MDERPTADIPHPSNRRPPQAPLCRPDSVPSQLAVARRRVNDGSPRPQPPHPQPVGSRPRPRAPRTGGRAWMSAPPWTPHTQARDPPSGALVPPPQRAKPAPKSARCGVGDRPQRPHPRQPVGSGPRPQAQRTGGRTWVSARLRTPHTQVRDASPLRALVRTPQPAKRARKSARGGVGGGSASLPPPKPRPVGSGPRTPQGRAVGRARAPNTGRPAPKQEAPPPQGALSPPRQHRKRARKSRQAAGGEATQSQARGRRDQATP